MSAFMTFFRAHAMSVTMVIGVIIGLLKWAGLFPYSVPSFVLPLLIFLMLFFTFLRIPPSSLKLLSWHVVLVIFQVVVSSAIFYALRPFDMALAQGVALCVLMPSATAAPIIASKLGGSIPNLTTFTLLSSASSAIIIPAIFPIWNPSAHIPFFVCFLQILRRVGPVLILPAACAWLLRAFSKKVTKYPSDIPFWLWMGTLVILMAKITQDVIRYDGSYSTLLYMALGALVTCAMQFYAGKLIGQRIDISTRITAGQGLGQKNTTLGIWLAATYLNPVSGIAPAAYIIWQNIFNSWQLARVAKGLKI